MKSKVLTALAFLVLTVFGLSAQKAEITFTNTTYDFGQINENDGNVSHVFEFTNTGDAPLVIQRVQASCGCTTPSWTKEPIAPGQKGTVTATYNPKGRPNSFHKMVTVYSNAKTEATALYIEGNVKGSTAQTNYAVTLPGGLSMTSRVVNMGNIIKNNTSIKSLNVKNNSATNISIDFSGVPAYIKVIASPSMLRPGQEGKIDFQYNAKESPVWGPETDDIFVLLNGNKSQNDNYKILLSASVTEDFNGMSAVDKKNSPIVEIKSPTVYFGTIKQGKKVKGKITLKNSGVNNLILRRVINNNSEISVAPGTLTVKSGKNGKLTVVIDTKGLQKGKYRKIISVVTNDPNNSYMVYNVTWDVI